MNKRMFWARAVFYNLKVAFFFLSQIQNQLFQLMQNDSSCDVKVAAINGELDSGSTDLTSYRSLYVVHIMKVFFSSKTYRGKNIA